MSLGSLLGVFLLCTSIANLTLLAAGALVSSPGSIEVCVLNRLSLHSCVVLELTGFGRLDAWTLILLLADLWTWSSSLNGADDADDDDDDDDDDENSDTDDGDDDNEQSRTRLLPTDA